MEAPCPPPVKLFATFLSEVVEAMRVYFFFKFFLMEVPCPPPVKLFATFLSEVVEAKRV